MRLVTDYKKHLNPCVRREVHGFMSASEIRESLDPGDKWYASIANIYEEVSSDASYKSSVEALQSDVTLADLDPAHPAREYQNVWDQLGLLDEEENTLMVMQGSRIIVPQGQWRRLLKLLHTPHCRTDKTIRTAKFAYYWLRMNTDIQNTCNSCASCATYVNLDYGVFGGKNYLIICDKLSGFIICRSQNLLQSSRVAEDYQIQRRTGFQRDIHGLGKVSECYTQNERHVSPAVERYCGRSSQKSQGCHQKMHGGKGRHRDSHV
jgi:hypothetical protein